MWRVCEKLAQVGDNPISPELAKLYLRVEGDAEDALIALFIQSVTEWAEHALRGSVALSEWKVSYAEVAPLCVLLPMGPVVEVTEVKTISAEGAESLVDAGDYALSGTGDRLEFKRRIAGHRVEIIYCAGYANVPAPLMQAMLLHLGHVFEMRSEAGDVPAHVQRVYDMFRIREV